MPESAEAYQDMIRHAATAAVVSDERGRIVHISVLTLKMFGYCEQEVAGQPIELLIPGYIHPIQEKPGFYCADAHADNPKMGAARRLKGRCKDGTEIAIEVSLSLVILHDEVHVTTWIHDDEKRQALENELRIHHDRLAHLGRVTFASEMVAGIAHELSQPLAAAVNYAEAIQMRMDTGRGDAEAVRELTAPLIEQTLRAGDIVRNLRDFISGRKPESGLCCIEQIIDRSLRFLRNELDINGICLEVEVEPGLPKLCCVEIQIAQVLDNLIRNAIDQLKPLPVERRRIALQVSSERGQLHLTLRDWGDGLTQATRARLFDPFYTTKARGMGVGLAICRTIVERHGGVLTADNAPEGGARFSFTLPSGLVKPGDESARPLAAPDYQKAS